MSLHESLSGGISLLFTVLWQQQNGDFCLHAGEVLVVSR